MFQTEQVKPYIPLTSKNILNLVSDVDIFRYYCNGADVQVGALILSPLRQDKTPTCSFYIKGNKLRIKDFATGYTGDCFDLVQQMYGCSFNDALKIINKDLNLGLGTSSGVNSTSTIQKSKVEYVPKDKPKIQVKITNYTQEDLDFWAQYGISKETLKKFHVYCVKDLYLNKELIARKKPGNPIFAYHFEKSDNLKIYQPFSHYKWVSNATSDDIQGAHMFVPNSDLIITSSLKDVMTLYELGYMSVAPQGEGNRFTESMIDLINLSNTVKLFYDNDTPGLINAKNRQIENPKISSIITLPGPEKDPSDYVKVRGKEALKEFLWSIL